jgi:hypothetical protein
MAWRIGEPFFCLAAAASGSLSFLVIWHFVLPFPRSCYANKKQTYSALPFYPQLHPIRFLKPRFALLASSRLSFLINLLDAMLRSTLRQKSSQLLKAGYSFTITSILLKCHIEDSSLRE